MLTAEIPLTQGKVAVIDEADLPVVQRYKWFAHKGGAGRYYAHTNVTRADGRRTTLTMHRLIMDEPDGDVDHRNRDGLDNRRSNLRVATRKENSRNRRGQENTSSRFKGVSWFKEGSCWGAHIGVDRHLIHLGLFDDEEAAALAYNAAAVEHYGEFACLNDVSGPAPKRRSSKRFVSAFGETKTIGEWLSDPRCQATSRLLVHRRLKQGWTDEEALTGRPRPPVSEATRRRISDLRKAEWASGQRDHMREAGIGQHKK